MEIPKFSKGDKRTVPLSLVVPNYRTPYEVHHIVAQHAPNAIHARKILEKAGIDCNSQLNLVALKTGLHRRLHTNLYYGWVNSVIISAYYSAGDSRTMQTSNVITALTLIRAFLLSMDALAPY